MADMPDNFYQSMNNNNNMNSICVKNYQAGATLTETYVDAEHLEKETSIKTASYGPDCSTSRQLQGGSLEASINSNVIGRARIAWQSVSKRSDSRRGQLLGRSIEDLVGVFSIQKFIQLWSDSIPGEISIDWMPCT
jgi:hypothetical protein